MNHLFLFSIGPVQSFIAQARKTQDLFAGSQLLSDLCKTGMEVIDKRYGREAIITPYFDSAAVPNRLLAKIDGDVEALGNDIEAAVKTQFKAIAATTFKGLTCVPAIEQQIDNHLDLFWLAVPVGNKGYENAYREIENSMGARKNVRRSTQCQYQEVTTGDILCGEKGRKCSLDGERNIVIYRRSKKEAGKSLDKKLH